MFNCAVLTTESLLLDGLHEW